MGHRVALRRDFPVEKIASFSMERRYVRNPFSGLDAVSGLYSLLAFKVVNSTFNVRRFGRFTSIDNRFFPRLQVFSGSETKWLEAGTVPKKAQVEIAGKKEVLPSQAVIF